MPNINAKYETGNITSSNIKATTNSVIGNGNDLSDEERVLEYARVQGVLTRNDVMALLKVSASTATRILQRLVKENLLKQNGKARNTHYSIIKK